MSNPLPNWETIANKQIVGRDWATIRNVWTAAALRYDPSSASDLSQILDPIVSPNFEKRPHISVLEFEGGNVAAFHDAASVLLKCAYVLRTVGNCLVGGQPTWASVDAYHFSLLACRALLAFLGIHIVHIQNTRCVLDIFPQGKLDQVRRKFRKAYPGSQNPARLIFRIHGSVIEQRALWLLLLRALHVTDLPAKVQKDADLVRGLGEGFGRSRNEMLYGNSQWLFPEDASQPTIGITINDDIYSYAGDHKLFFADQRDANFAFSATLIRLLIALTSDVQAQSGVNILQTSYAPCLVSFDGFSHAKIDGLYAKLYRKEGFGIDL